MAHHHHLSLPHHQTLGQESVEWNACEGESERERESDNCLIVIGIVLNVGNDDDNFLK